MQTVLRENASQKGAENSGGAASSFQEDRSYSAEAKSFSASSDSEKTADPQESSSVFHRLSAAAPAAAAAFFSLLFLVLYADVIFGEKIIAWRDMLFVYLPTRLHFFRRILAGEFPQWYPFDGLGSSFIGNTVTGLFHPAALLHLVLPDTRAVGAGAALCHLFSALGVFALARRWKCETAAAFSAAAAYSLGGYLVSMDGNIPYLAAAVCIPWAVLGVESLSIPLCAFSMACLAFSGDPQALYFTSLFLTSCALSHPQRKKAIFTLAASGLLAFLCAAPQLIPSFLSSESRNSGAISLEINRQWSLNPLRLIQMITPGFLRSPETGLPPAELFFQTDFGSFWSDSLFIGPAVLAFAFCALIPLRGRTGGTGISRQAFLSASLGGFSLLTALGIGTRAPVYELLQRTLPFFSLLRYPEKGMVFFTFAASLLAAFGISRCIPQMLQRKSLLPMYLLAACALITGTCAFLLPFFGNFPIILSGNSLHSPSAAAEYQEMLPVFQRELTAGAVFSAAALVSFFAAMRLRSESARNSALKFATAASVLLPALFVFSFSEEYRRPIEDLSAPEWLRKSSIDRGAAEGYPRIHITQEAVDSVLSDPAITPGDPRPFIAVLKNGTGGLFSLETIGGYLPLTAQGRQQKAQSALRPEVFIRGFSAQYALKTESGSASETPNANFQSRLMSETLNPPERIRLVRGIPAISPEDAAEKANSAFFDAADSIPVEVEVGSKIPLSPPKNPALSVDLYTPERIEITASSDSDCILFAADAFASGWSAEIDGLSTDIRPGLIAGRAIVFPRGKHQVIFSYKTPGLRLSLVLSAAGFTIILILFFTQLRRRKSTTAASVILSRDFSSGL